ncbi:MAG TPA: alpha/beta fold hydrolase [Telluria sp.]|nr:alpha/beta fold hydrolase [Telluria sp.]
MTARLLQFLLLVQAAAVGVLAWLFVRANAVPWAVALFWALLCVLALRFLICMNNFVMAWRLGDPGTAVPLAWPARARMLLREFGATMLHSSWLMPRARACMRVYASGAAPPVLLVHGYGCNSGYWSHLIARLDAAGISHGGVDLEPMFASIDDFAPALAQAVERLRAATGAARVTLVAHSMGGLVCRAYLRAFGDDAVARVVTLGTPHHGSRLAALGLGANARQMRRDSGWLRELAAAESSARRARFTSIYTRHDNIVAPYASAELAGARNLAFDGVGHVALGGDAAVLDCLMQEIRHA